MKIIIFEIEEWEKEAFRGLEKTHDVIYVPNPLTIDNIDAYKDADIISVFIYSKLSASVLGHFQNLCFIATRSTGYDHIDLDFCKQHKLTVSNVPTYGENTVAEHVFALLLALSHRIIESVDRTQKGNFSSEGLQGFDLLGKTLGVIGVGHIGRHVIRIAKGFEMNVLACDLYEDKKLEEELDFQYVSKETLLSGSDVISLHSFLLMSLA